MLERTLWPVIVYRLVVLGLILAVCKDQEKDMFSDFSFILTLSEGQCAGEHSGVRSSIARVITLVQS